jgi:K+-transporting ATPase ATPase C chain
MFDHFRRSIILALLCTVFFGFIYALAGTGVAQALFPHQADGSLTANGSTLIGQNWAQTPCPGHALGSCVFHGRPDDTGPYAANPKQDVTGGDDPYQANNIPGQPKVMNPGSSAATNYGPRSKLLLNATQAMVAYWKGLGVDDPTPDLVTTSGSGYDPDITPQDATVQIPMVAAATGVSPSALAALIKRETHGAQLGFLGSDYLNVLQLNEALAALH